MEETMNHIMEVIIMMMSWKLYLMIHLASIERGQNVIVEMKGMKSMYTQLTFMVKY